MLVKVTRCLALNIVSKQALEGLFHLGHHLDSLNKKSEVITHSQGKSEPHDGPPVCPTRIPRARSAEKRRSKLLDEQLV